MTLPDERYRAIKHTRYFLLKIMDPKQTPRIPKALREEAFQLLRHYPHNSHLDYLSKKSPDVIIEHMEPLTKLLMTYKDSKNDNAS